MEERTIYAGMDIRENRIQMCAYPPEGGEIKMLLEDYPLVIAIEEEKKEWLYGETALEKRGESSAVVISDFLELLKNTEELQIFGVRFAPEELLAKVIKKALLALKREFPNDLIKRITVSIEEPEKKVTERLTRAFLKLGIDEDRLRVESHGQSFLCYALSRKRELWTGEVGLLDGSSEGVIYRRISLDRKKRPMIAGVTKMTLPGEEVQREALLELIKPEIGTLYLTGTYFGGEEKELLVRSLCRGRRGFLGENLYCVGACVSSRRQTEPDIMESFLFLEEESTKCEISIPVYHDAADCRAVLIKASDLWYEAEGSACLILDGEEEIPVKVLDVLSGVEKVYLLALDGLWRRPKRMTKALIKAAFTEPDTCIITVKDLGFGEFSPSSRRIWEKTITI